MIFILSSQCLWVNWIFIKSSILKQFISAYSLFVIYAVVLSSPLNRSSSHSELQEKYFSKIHSHEKIHFLVLARSVTLDIFKKISFKEYLKFSGLLCSPTKQCWRLLINTYKLKLHKIFTFSKSSGFIFSVHFLLPSTEVGEDFKWTFGVLK